MIKKQKSIARLLRNVVLFPMLAVIVIVNILLAIQVNRMMYFGDNPQKLPRKTKEQITTSEKFFGLNQLKRPVNDSFSIPHDTINLTADGFQLESWYAHHDTISRGMVLLFHGFGSSKDECTRPATFFFNQGYDVLLTDFVLAQ